MKHVATAARLLLGLIYLVFGLNGFLQFIPLPPLPDAAGAFMAGLGNSGYFFPVLKITEILVGLSLLTGFFVPLSLVIIAPVTIHIFLFHAVLTPGIANVVLPIVMVAANAYLGWSNMAKYKPMLAAK